MIHFILLLCSLWNVQAALMTDPANLYYCPAGTCLGPKRNGRGFSGPADMFVQCTGEDGESVDVVTYNWALENDDRDLEHYFTAMENGHQVPKTMDDVPLATTCCAGFQTRESDYESWFHNQCLSWTEEESESSSEDGTCDTADECRAPLCGRAFCVDGECISEEIACDLPPACPDGSIPKPVGDCCDFVCPDTTCPDILEFTFGICQSECESDEHCRDDSLDSFFDPVQQVCCGNGCGQVCKDPVSRLGESCGGGAFWHSPECVEGLECRPAVLDPRIMDGGNICKTECPMQKCKNFCVGGRVLDEFGCETCECNDVCPEMICAINCANGMAVDENGCPICRCNECPMVKCRMYCEEYETDDNDCEICQCKPQECEAELCEIHCEFGFKTNKKGCEYCECEEERCPLLGCNQFMGCVEVDTDGDGCGDACKCKEAFNCRTRESWTPEKQAWCCENKGACPRCEEQEDCEEAMTYPEGSCMHTGCLEGRCGLFTLDCMPPLCEDGTTPDAIEGECCGFESCQDASALKGCKETGRKSCLNLYKKKFGEAPDMCYDMSCNTETGRCNGAMKACDQPVCEDGTSPEVDDSKCCGFFLCPEACDIKKKKQCRKKKGCMYVNGEGCTVDMTPEPEEVPCNKIKDDAQCKAASHCKAKYKTKKGERVLKCKKKGDKK